MKPLFRFFGSFLLALAPSFAFAAACCGGGFAAPSLIVGDDRAQWSASYSRHEVVVESVDASGLWTPGDLDPTVQIFKLDGAFLLSDRWQTGASVPVVARERAGDHSQGLGDVALTLGYEALPDWDYNPYRPKGVAFLQTLLPTGKARAESEDGGLDSRGQGFTALGAGIFLLKSWKRWDAFASTELHRSFQKRISTSLVRGTLEPGWGGQAGLGGGYNLRDWRLGGSLMWANEEAVRLRGESPSPGAPERYTTGSLSATYLASTEWSGSFVYSDQTLFGSPSNTSLGRGLTLQLQRHWLR